MHNQQHPCRLLLIGQYKSTPQNQALLLQEFILLLAASRTNEPPYLRAPIGPLFTKAAERGYTLVEVAGLLGTSMCLALRAVLAQELGLGLGSHLVAPDQDVHRAPQAGVSAV